MAGTITPERSAMLLADARRFAGIKSDTWPGELRPGSLAALMAGGWKDEKKEEYRKWLARIVAAIKDKSLCVRTDQLASTTVTRRVSGGNDTWVHRYALPPAYGDVRVTQEHRTTNTPAPRCFIGATAVAAWLVAISETPTEHVRAWLGEAWQDKAAESKQQEVPETVRERNKRIASAVLDMEMTKDAALKEGVKPDNLKRILADERRRRAGAAGPVSAVESNLGGAAGASTTEPWHLLTRVAAKP